MCVNKANAILVFIEENIAYWDKFYSDSLTKQNANENENFNNSEQIELLQLLNHQTVILEENKHHYHVFEGRTQAGDMTVYSAASSLWHNFNSLRKNSEAIAKLKNSAAMNKITVAIPSFGSDLSEVTNYNLPSFDPKEASGLTSEWRARIQSAFKVSAQKIATLEKISKELSDTKAGVGVNNASSEFIAKCGTLVTK
jgi:hypothetical protein